MNPLEDVVESCDGRLNPDPEEGSPLLEETACDCGRLVVRACDDERPPDETLCPDDEKLDLEDVGCWDVLGPLEEVVGI